MAKKVDKTGIWKVKRNPLTKEGVFPYSGKVIDPTGKEYGLEPDKFYNVYRPFSEISSEKFIESLEGKPIINGHIMLGAGRDVGGVENADTLNTCGSVSKVYAENGVVYGDLTIWSETLQTLINSGKKELSLGYIADYRKEEGEFDGVKYDFIQCEHEANHVALVARGRMGSGVRVYDSFTTDSMEILPMEKEEKKDVREEISELLKGASDEACTKVKDAIESILNPSKSEDEGEKKEEKKVEGEEVEVEHIIPDEDEKKEEAKDEDEKKKEEPAPEKKTTGDSAPTMKELLKAVAKRDAMYKKVSAIDKVGTFDCSEMLEKDVADYACKRLGFKSVTDSVEFINGYLAKGTEKKETRFTSDSAETETDSGFIADYLNQK